MAHSVFRPALFFTALSAFLLFASPQNAAAAALTNGGFETGSFSPWVVSEISFTSIYAPAFVSGASFTNAMGVATNVTPAEGSYQAVLNAPTSGTTFTPQLETFLGLQSDTLSALYPGSYPYASGGSAIKQTFDVRDGSVISFQWNFLPNGTNSSVDQNDSGFFTLHAAAVTNSTNYTVLSTTISSGGNPTGYQPYTTGPLTAGSYLLGFSAFNTQQGYFTDAQQPTLLIDAVNAYVPNLYVGSNSSGVTTNFTSGTHYYENTYLGFSSTASNNTLNVSGAGTVLTNYTDLYVGFEGSSNRLVISNGGTVAVAGDANLGQQAGADGNSLTVGGGAAASSLTVGDVINVGFGGTGNTLGILSNGTVNAASMRIGGYGASNTVNVTGGALIATNDLVVGYFTAGNAFNMSAGGSATAGSITVGLDQNASSNAVRVSGIGSVLQTAGLFYLGEGGSSNSLVLENGGKVLSQTSDVALGLNAGANGNALSIGGAGSQFSNNATFYVGRSGSANTLSVENAGSLVTKNSRLGSDAGSSNNIAIVSGTGSVWTNTGTMRVGSGGSGNTLLISNGGKVETAGNAFIGYSNTSGNNSALVSGAGSLWTNSKDLVVGYSGGGSLTVAEGGTVAASNIVIAGEALSSGALNIGRFGTNDAAGTINAPTVDFGAGTGTINFNQSNSTTVSAAISGAGTVNQLGSGTTILSGTSSYNGATTVSAGKLVVNGSIASSAVTVDNGGTLAGSGSVGGLIVNSGGTISPGNSPGNLTVANNMLWNGGGNYNWQVLGTTGTPGTTWDLITVTGDLDLSTLQPGNKFNINLWSLSSPGSETNGPIANFNSTNSYEWLAVSASNINGFNAAHFAVNVGATNGTGGFSNALDGSYAFGVRQVGGNLYVTYGQAAPIPEPGTWAAMALFAGGAAYAGWRRRKGAKVG